MYLTSSSSFFIVSEYSLIICKFCWSFRANLEELTHSAVCWRIAALDNFSPSWWGSRVRSDAKPEIKILNILANRKKSFGLAKVRIICKNELLLLYSFFCIELVLHGKYFFYLLFYCIFHLSWCFAYAVSRCCWRSPVWKNNHANRIIITNIFLLEEQSCKLHHQLFSLFLLFSTTSSSTWCQISIISSALPRIPTLKACIFMIKSILIILPRVTWSSSLEVAPEPLPRPHIDRPPPVSPGEE